MNLSNTKLFIMFFPAGLLLLSGCDVSSSFEMSVSLLPPMMENADPDAAAPEPIDPLEVLVAVEKVAVNVDLRPYTPGDEEASLLDMADADLLGSYEANSLNVTEYKHPDLPVYLSITRKPEEILILLNHTPGVSGKVDPDAVKLYKNIENQLTEVLAALRTPNE